MIIEECAGAKVLLSAVIDNLPSAIIVVDRDRRVILANKMTEMFANKSKDPFYGLYCGEAFGCVNSKTDDRGCGFASACEFCTVKNTVLNTFADHHDKSMIEAEMIFFETGKKFLKISTTYLPLSDREAVILAMEDITALKIHEKLRMENEKLSAAIETGGAVCHELNQPLMAVCGYLGIMMLDGNESDPNFKMLNDVQAQVVRMGKITRKLMNVTRYKTKDYLKGKIIDL